MEQEMPDVSWYKRQQLPVEFVTGIMNSLYNPDVRAIVKFEEVRDALSLGQLASKLWLVDRLDEVLGARPKFCSIVVVGGWFGYLARLILMKSHHRIWLKQVVTYDVDPRCEEVCYKTHIEFTDNFTAETCDAQSYQYDKWGDNLVIINTSCEHMSDEWAKRVPEGSLLVAQSNDYRALSEHVNCVDDAEELSEKLKLREVLYSGEMSYQKYKRFMVIGIK